MLCFRRFYHHIFFLVKVDRYSVLVICVGRLSHSSSNFNLKLRTWFITWLSEDL